MLAKLGEKCSPFIHFIFRVAVGLLFFQHGAQKLFGLFTERPPIHFPHLLFFAGVIEFFGGLMIAIGFLTRYVCFIAAGEMVFAFFIAHFPQGWIPIETGGELPLLYCACHLMLVWLGAGRFSVDALICKDYK